MAHQRRRLLPPLTSRLYRDIIDRARATPAGTRAFQFGPYVLLPMLGAGAALAPALLSTRLTFLLLLVVAYLMLRIMDSVYGLVVLAGTPVLLPQGMDGFERHIMVNLALYTLLGIGLNVVVGYAGLLDLGYVAFFAAGAYLYALLSAPAYGGGFDTGTSFWLVLPM